MYFCSRAGGHSVIRARCRVSRADLLGFEWPLPIVRRRRRCSSTSVDPLTMHANTIYIHHPSTTTRTPRIVPFHFWRPPPTMGPFAIIYANCTNNNEHRYRCIFRNSEFGGVNSYCTRKVAYYKVYGLCCEMEGEQMYLVFNNSTLYYVLCSSAGQ